MGYGGYSFEAHQAITRARTDLPVQQVFKQKQTHALMSPYGVKLRESRDSAAHPSSVGIVLALDVTGSMGQIPDLLARRELPGFVKLLMDHGVRDPQVLFMAVGDAFGDQAPLQVGQFESTAELMDQWLTWTWLEGGGGQGTQESYELALYFAARHTDLDCWTKRRKRGYLFMTGDERPYPRLSQQVVRSVIGDELDEDLPLAVVVDEVQRAFNPFFLIPDLDRRPRCERVWRDLLGDHVIAMESPADTTAVMAGIVAIAEGTIDGIDALADRLRDRGHPKERIGPVMRALIPWAATLGKDGAPAPKLDLGAKIA